MPAPPRARLRRSSHARSPNGTSLPAVALAQGPLMRVVLEREMPSPRRGRTSRRFVGEDVRTPWEALMVFLDSRNSSGRPLNDSWRPDATKAGSTSASRWVEGTHNMALGCRPGSHGVRARGRSPPPSLSRFERCPAGAETNPRPAVLVAGLRHRMADQWPGWWRLVGARREVGSELARPRRADEARAAEITGSRELARPPSAVAAAASSTASKSDAIASSSPQCYRRGEIAGGPHNLIWGDVHGARRGIFPAAAKPVLPPPRRRPRER